MSQLLFYSINADLLAVTAHTLELNNAVNLCEKSIVRTLAYIGAGVDVSATLSYKDVTCKNKLTVSTLCAESLGFGITAVTGGTHTFLMSEKLNVYLKH